MLRDTTAQIFPLIRLYSTQTPHFNVWFSCIRNPPSESDAPKSHNEGQGAESASALPIVLFRGGDDSDIRIGSPDTTKLGSSQLKDEGLPVPTFCRCLALARPFKRPVPSFQWRLLRPSSQPYPIWYVELHPGELVAFGFRFQNPNPPQTPLRVLWVG